MGDGTDYLLGDVLETNGFRVTAAGNAYVWTTDEDLFLNTPQQNYDFGRTVQPLVLNNGNYYVLSVYGNLYENTTLVQANVYSFSVSSSGQLSWQNSGPVIPYPGSANWSGYVAEAAGSPITGTNGTVTAVSGTWIVPTVSGPSNSASCVWVGIDGYGGSTVEQVGTEEDEVNGQSQYYAWWEMAPAAQVEIGSPVKPGDEINAQVIYLPSGNPKQNQFELFIQDVQQNWSFETFQGGSADRSTAEWIVEATQENGSEATLANFGSTSFFNTWAVINGVGGPINDPSFKAYQVGMADPNGGQDWAGPLADVPADMNITTPPTPTIYITTTTQFTVTYGAQPQAASISSVASASAGATVDGSLTGSQLAMDATSSLGPAAAAAIPPTPGLGASAVDTVLETLGESDTDAGAGVLGRLVKGKGPGKNLAPSTSVDVSPADALAGPLAYSA